MANSPLVDNKKIIQEKMDELIVNKIISSGSEADALQFDVVLQCLAKFKGNDNAYKWLSLTNNLVGFAVGLRKSGTFVLSLNEDEFVRQINVFDDMRKIVKGTTLIISHQERILNIADEVILLKQGKVEEYKLLPGVVKVIHDFKFD